MPDHQAAIESIRSSYDRVADAYAATYIDELKNKPFDRDALLRFARETAGHGPVCDMGCGPGQAARFLSDAGADVFGLDLSPGMIAEARRLNSGIEFREGNMQALPLEGGSLAGITAFYAIVNLPAEMRPQVFREMTRVLKPGGLLLLTFHIGGEVLGVDQLWGRPITMKFHTLNRDEVLGELEGEGLRIEECLERDPYPPPVEHQSRRAYVFARKPASR
ncbi:MAG: class I SAM-dependent methyltransferase [Terracidiphilus sp.]